MKVLVVCFGNVLRGDDGFGVVVAERLLAGGIPPGVRVTEVGIGGIHLVQDLLDPVDALVAVDALDLGRHPGTVVVLRPEIEAVDLARRPDMLADMHYATPERALMLAGALELLPAQTLMVGCQLVDPDQLGEGLTPPVEASVDEAVAQVRQVVSELGIAWT